uniref:Uncharacterized protein n=1 Tax=Glossina pallidipes TaxID=7398 RepID=A0A1A9Z335_GLOPL
MNGKKSELLLFPLLLFPINIIETPSSRMRNVKFKSFNMDDSVSPSLYFIMPLSFVGCVSLKRVYLLMSTRDNFCCIELSNHLCYMILTFTPDMSKRDPEIASLNKKASIEI